VKVDPTQLKAIVFDVDGTLYAQSGLRRAMLLQLVRAHVARPWTGFNTFRVLAAYRRAQEDLREEPIAGDLAGAQVQLACRRAGAPEELVRRLVARWMEEAPLPLLPRFMDPELPALLRAARERGVRLGVFSDYPAAEKLRALGVAEFFEVVLTAQDPAVNRFKPDPSGLREALRRLRAEGAEALYVGDRAKVDAAAAEAAGVPCVILNPRKNGGDQRTFSEVAGYAELRNMLFSPTPGPKS
jgi:phosphoglycolate phosphatase/putative hydrolase of the HAD superfamily